jgi:hypothetical protein
MIRAKRQNCGVKKPGVANDLAPPCHRVAIQAVHHQSGSMVSLTVLRALVFDTCQSGYLTDGVFSRTDLLRKAANSTVRPPVPALSYAVFRFRQEPAVPEALVRNFRSSARPPC